MGAAVIAVGGGQNADQMVRGVDGVGQGVLIVHAVFQKHLRPQLVVRQGHILHVLHFGAPGVEGGVEGVDHQQGLFLRRGGGRLQRLTVPAEGTEHRQLIAGGDELHAVLGEGLALQDLRLHRIGDARLPGRLRDHPHGGGGGAHGLVLHGDGAVYHHGGGGGAAAAQQSGAQKAGCDMSNKCLHGDPSLGCG